MRDFTDLWKSKYKFSFVQKCLKSVCSSTFSTNFGRAHVSWRAEWLVGAHKSQGTAGGPTKCPPSPVALSALHEELRSEVCSSSLEGTALHSPERAGRAPGCKAGVGGQAVYFRHLRGPEGALPHLPRVLSWVCFPELPQIHVELCVPRLPDTEFYLPGVALAAAVGAEAVPYLGAACQSSRPTGHGVIPLPRLTRLLRVPVAWAVSP